MLEAVERKVIISGTPVLVFSWSEENFAGWRKRLEDLGVPAFCVASLREAMTILGECEREGTPVGLVVLEKSQWDASAQEALLCLREFRTELELPIFVHLGAESEGEATTLKAHLAALEAGADHCFVGEIDEAVFRVLARQKLNGSARILRLRQEREKAIQDLRQERQSAMAQDLWRLNLATRELQFSEQCTELSGYQPQELGNGLDEWLGLIHPEDLTRLSLALGSDRVGASATESTPEEWNFEFRLRHKSGSWRWLLLRARLEKDSSGSAISVLGTHTDITRSKTTDNVTGLPNRFSFEENLARILAQGRFQPTVFLVGIDRHQMLRDSLGQDLGDALLRLVAERLEAAVKDLRQETSGTSLVARLSGDEFAVVLEAAADIQQAGEAALRLERVLSRAFWLDGREIYVSTSQGIAQWDPKNTWKSSRRLELSLNEVGVGVEEARELWRGAEIALHNAQSSGGARIVFFDEEMRAKVVERMELESEMKRAIERWEFEVYYQPKVSLYQERIIGFEALIRWRHPERGIIPPSVFIPLAEENGLILPLGIRTIREACEALARWQRAFPQTPVLEMSVNLSVRQFQDQQLPNEIRAVLRDTAIPPNTLLFEVTESVLVDDPASALEIVEELRRMGVGLKIDDFGTGYSSLSYLHRLPFDTLKIDKSFIATMGQDHSAFEIVKAIIALARNLGLQVVAEGVETRNQADELREMGCEYAQGYLYAPPLTADAAGRMLEVQRVFERDRLLAGSVATPGAAPSSGPSRGIF
jgi:diguanylate cyclase (GGDEF)-like protein/PAS domain S-box-containing protein